MSNYFTSSDDLQSWVKSRKSSDEAATELLGIIGQGNPVNEEQDIVDSCRSIFDNSDQNASDILFGVLAKHNLTTMQKESCEECQIKESSSNKKIVLAQDSSASSRQRNDWERGMRNKWNRCIHGFNEGTPWRIDRDKMFNFTHYYTDAISFDEDPTAVYSGEAIWRTYIMDKYSSEYQDKNGKYVGGYINDRFYVFPDAGTPSNPDVPRDGGNQMQLALGEKTRKPRPHQWSVERRLEDARGVKTTDLEAKSASKDDLLKVSSIKEKDLSEDRHTNKVYNIFKDTIEMREAGFKYEDMIKKVAEHYETSILNVAQIDMEAQKIIKKHSNIFYGLEKKANINPKSTFVIERQVPVISGNQESFLQPETVIVSIGNGMFEAINDPSGIKSFKFAGEIPMNSIRNLDQEANGENDEFTIQEAADEVGLNDVSEQQINETNFNVQDQSEQVNQDSMSFPVEGI